MSPRLIHTKLVAFVWFFTTNSYHFHILVWTF